MRGWASDTSVKVSIGVPPFTIDGAFTPSKAERLAAWELLVELASRTSVTALRDDEGSVREALSSLYALFDVTRKLLREHGPEVGASRRDGNLSLALIALRVLNDILRPVLSTWHPRLLDHEAMKPEGVGAVEWERLWNGNDDCRAALRRTRHGVRAYIDTLARVARTPDVADAVLPIAPARPIHRTKRSTWTPTDGWNPRRHMTRWVSLLEGGHIGLVKWRSRKVGRTAAGPERDAPAVAIDHRGASADCWFDVVADLGDAFEPTVAVAWQIGRGSIRLPADPTGEMPVPPDDLPRGSLLVMAGDEVYPYSSKGRYRDQLVIPYDVGFEVVDASTQPRPLVVAIPGNHDWMGDIAEFDATFLQGRDFGEHRRTVQDRRWWAVQLPHDWWLWGIDLALGDELGEEQEEWFERLGATLSAGAKVVLVLPVPLWQLRAKRPETYVRLRQTIEGWLTLPPTADAPPADAGSPGDAGSTGDAGTTGEPAKRQPPPRRKMPLVLSGDSHYFAVHEHTDPERPEVHVTSGGGGAFLHPTHSLAERVPYEGGRAEYELITRWPRPADSRAVSPRLHILRDRQSYTVVPVIALLHFVYTGLVAWRGPTFGAITRPGGWPQPFGYVLGAPLSWPILGVLVLAGAATAAPNALERWVTRGARAFGVLHGIALAAFFAASVAGISWVADTWLDIGPTWGRIAARVIGSLVAGAIGLAGFLAVVGWIGDRYRMNDNLSFSAVHSGRYKHFLRCRIDHEGDLTVFAVGIDPIGKGWEQALRNGTPVPPHDPDGIPMLHYLWGRTFAGGTDARR